MSALSGEQVIEAVKKQIGGKTLLAFSGGKDSIGCYIALRDHFEVVPFYLYRVPGLEFVEDSLQHYERVMKTKIIRLPHEALPRWLNNYIFQSPGNAAVIEAAQIPEHEYSDSIEWACEIAGLDHNNMMAAIGTRSADNPYRRLAFMKHGAINKEKKQYSPIWDWNKDRLLDSIEKSGITLSIDYKLFGRSFDGLDYRFLAPIKKHFPRDWKKLCEWFPLCEAEIYRYERGAL
jgi:3'-phosphoadenosine 5'-phosphosulfate sulfotransferase (PAPS reductase)/FAD synthetase